jgi:hypothetical protein
MCRIEATLFATFTLGFLPCAAQTPSQDLEQQLASGQPHDIAWAAYTAARQGRREMIPNLAALVASYQPGPIAESGPVPPELAAIEAVADAFIPLPAKLPAATIMHLYPQLPAQTVILLSLAPDNTAPLLEIFRNTPWRDLWLAAGNLLALHPPPEFVRSLLDGVVVNFELRVVAPWDKSEVPGEGSACAGDSFMRPDDAFRDWPKARMYALQTDGHAMNVFAPGIHPSGYRYWETTDYRDPWTDGDCSHEKSRYWRTGLLAQLLRTSIDGFPVQAQITKTVTYYSPESFEQDISTIIGKQATAFESVVGSFVQSGILSTEDAAPLQLKCRIQIKDDRPSPHQELPIIEGKWCLKF